MIYTFVLKTFNFNANRMKYTNVKQKWIWYKRNLSFIIIIIFWSVVFYSSSLLLEQVEHRRYLMLIVVALSIEWIKYPEKKERERKHWHRLNWNQNDFNHGNYISTNNCLMLKFTSFTGRMWVKYKSSAHAHARILMCTT